MPSKRYNEVRHRADGVTEVVLTQGKIALIDTESYPLIAPYKWNARQTRGLWYAQTNTGGRLHRGSLQMHRLIAPDGYRVDHKDGDGLNNRRHNLRPVTHSQNIFNQKARERRKYTKFRGVSFDKRRASQKRPWYAQIMVDYKNYIIGSFETAREAYHARLLAEQVYRPGIRVRT